MHHKAFDWFVPNDDNRAEDGRELRWEFLNENGLAGDDLWMDLDCSFLEMLIGLSRRVAFESYGSPGEWFRRILENLEFIDYTDRGFNSISALDVDRTLERINNRTYDRNGHGGIFPLHHAAEDQRKVEIWYQMSAYLLSNGYVDNYM